jgi:phosphate uptake regulator
LALESPVAVDLRFIYAVIEINDAVERIADYAVIISGTVVNKDLNISSEDTTLKALVTEVSEFFKDSEKAFFLRESEHVKQIAEKELKSEKQIHDILLNACMVKSDDTGNLAAFSITHAFYRMLIKIRRIAEASMFYIEGTRSGANC